MLFSGHDSHCTHGLSGAMANCSNRHESLHRAQSTFQQAALTDSVDCYFGFFFTPRAEDGSQGLALARQEF